MAMYDRHGKGLHQMHQMEIKSDEFKPNLALLRTRERDGGTLAARWRVWVSKKEPQTESSQERKEQTGEQRPKLRSFRGGGEAT